jgi:glucose-6-phosphate-specific signal transduction histidine kinase
MTADGPNAEFPQLGVGIPGMRTRVTQLGGTLQVRCPGRGTVLEAVVPLPCEAAA